MVSVGQFEHLLVNAKEVKNCPTQSIAITRKTGDSKNLKQGHIGSWVSICFQGAFSEPEKCNFSWAQSLFSVQ